MPNTYILSSSGELYHYGVKGMKWGKRKNRPQSSTNGRRSRNAADNNADTNKEVRNARTKKVLKIGAAVAGTTLAAYGAYKVSKIAKEKAFDKVYSLGEKAVLKAFREHRNGPLRDIDLKDARTRNSVLNSLVDGTEKYAKSRSSTTGKAVKTLLSPSRRVLSDDSLRDLAKYGDWSGIIR